MESVNSFLINMFQDAFNLFQEAMSSPDHDKWLTVSQEEFEGLTEMGVWKSVTRPKIKKQSSADGHM